MKNLHDAYSKRFESIAYGSYGTLVQKKQKLSDYINKLDERINEIKEIKSVYDREIKTEFSNQNEKLKAEAGKNLAIMQHDMNVLVKDIENINNIFNTINSFTTGERRDDQVGYLKIYRDLNEKIETIITKSIVNNTDKINLDCFEYQMVNIKQLFKRINEQQISLKRKDDTIWNLLQEKKRIHEQSKVDEENVKEINIFTKITDRYAQEILNMQMKCVFCGTSADRLTVNEMCPSNSKEQELNNINENVPKNRIGDKYHYFIRPKIEEENKNSPRLSLNINPIIILNEAAKQKQLNLHEELKKLDFQGIGEISKIDFEEFLELTLELPEDEIKAIMKTISSKPREVNKSNIELLLNSISPRYKKETKQKASPVKKLNQSIKSNMIEESPKKLFPFLYEPVPRPIVNQEEREDMFSIKSKILFNIKESSINLHELISKYDMTGQGFISSDNLRLVFYKMNKDLTSSEVESFIKSHIVSNEQEMIYYPDFITKIYQ